jgi:hypothetical protein
MGNLVPDPVQFQPPGKEVAVWMPSFLQGLNAFLLQTVRAFQDLATGGTVYRPLFVQTRATAADSFPIVMPNPLKRPPQDIHIARVLPSGSSVLLGPVTVVWAMTSAGAVAITDITNLDSDSTYDVTLAVS